MLAKLWSALAGKKTYLLSVLGIIIAVVGHFAGPIQAGPIDIPMIDSDTMWRIIWNSGLFSTIRSGIANKTEAPK